jgi:FlaA1/EpsC-like NDP-sugar epimerase
MGEPVYIYDLACDLCRINGLVPEKDIEIRITGLRPGEKMFEELRYDDESAGETAHEGIFVTKLEGIDSNRFSDRLAQLEQAAFNQDDAKSTEIIFEIVPSVYRESN